MIARLLHFLRRRIAVKLAVTLVGFVLVSILVAGLYLNRALEAFAMESLEARLVIAGRLLHDETLALLKGRAEPAAIHAFAARAARLGDVRVTVIAPDGRVLGDSDVALADLARVENHAGRPEVRAAFAGHVGRDFRTSATINAPLFYVALPVRAGGVVVGVLRLALPLSTVTASYADLHRVMLLGGGVALLAALAIGLFVARRLTSPVVHMLAVAREMSEGNFTVQAPVRSPDEIGVLGRALNGLAARLRERV